MFASMVTDVVGYLNSSYYTDYVILCLWSAEFEFLYALDVVRPIFRGNVVKLRKLECGIYSAAQDLTAFVTE
jgi:hypothetical protein